MKKLTLLISGILLSYSIAFSQYGWNQQVSNTGVVLKACQFLNSSTGYIAGSDSVLFTSNAGNTWISKSSGTLTQGINGLSFIDANTGWLTGTSGIVKTTNGGNNWTLQEPGSSNATKDIFFYSSNNGWAVGTGGVILKTTNGGTSWSASTSGTTNNLNAVFFVSSTVGWTVGANATILKTTDGGNSWTSQSSGTFTGELHDINFVDENIGFLAGTGGTVLKTTNGGTLWTRLDTKNTQDFYFVHFVDSNHGWAGGFLGTIINTRDGGNTWKLQSTTVVSPLYDVYFISRTIGWACGTQGKIIHSSTGGEEVRALFTADTTLGIKPFTVHFTNQSTGYPDSYSWSFGDGATSTEENPTHTYTTGGEFNVALSVTSGTYTDTRNKQKYIIVDDILKANFTANPTAGSATLTVNFQDASLSKPDTWLWDFGDGTSSTFKNPTHNYASAGKYNVSLTVTNYQGTSTETKNEFITVYEPVQAAFQGAPLTGKVPLTVYFVDYSPGHPNSWEWSFGDGATSNEQNPNHTYTSSGTYTVTLTVSDGIHSDTKSFHGYIKVIDALNPNFTASPRNGALPLTVSFTDQSYGGPNNWRWDFGDGQTSNEQNPQHTYLLPGTYDVELTISDGTFHANELKNDYIVVTGTPVLESEFTASPLSGLEPLKVQFTDMTQGGVLSRVWIFGDGQTSTEKNPKHTYQNDGIYSVKLIVTNGLNYDTTYKENYITVYPNQTEKLKADFEADITTGKKPILIQFFDRSTGKPTSYLWNFGDGNTSTINGDVMNYYSTSGTFTVSLTIRDSTGKSDTATKENYIIVYDPINVEDFEQNRLISESYPNPFSHFTNIRYKISETSRVTVSVYDLLGNEIAKLIDYTQNSGSYSIIWQPLDSQGYQLNSGLYYYKITTQTSSGISTFLGKLILSE
jgi:PKD repeat protein